MGKSRYFERDVIHSRRRGRKKGEIIDVNFNALVIKGICPMEIIDHSMEIIDVNFNAFAIKEICFGTACPTQMHSRSENM